MRELGRDSEWIPMVGPDSLQYPGFYGISMDTDRPYVAVASSQGRFVDEHLGLAPYLWIYGKKDHRFGVVETRKNPDPTKGESRWHELADMLKDCRAVLVSGAATPPAKVLNQEGIAVIDAGGKVEDALEKIYAVTNED